MHLFLIAQVAELVDALVSGTSAERRGGSSPLLGTISHESQHTLAFLLPARQPNGLTPVRALTCIHAGNGHRLPLIDTFQP